MLKAVQHNKTKLDYEKKEDGLTSSVFQLLLYLPAKELWQILRSSIYENGSLDEDLGDLQDIQFWPQWYFYEDGSKTRVEPDVFLSFKKTNIILEAKRWDAYQQDEGQWEREIKAYREIHQQETKEAAIFIALGGINKARQEICLGMKVYKSRWSQLLNNIQLQLNKTPEEQNGKRRLLEDLVDSFSIHGYFLATWLEEIPKNNTIQIANTNINSWKIPTI